MRIFIFFFFIHFFVFAEIHPSNHFDPEKYLIDRLSQRSITPHQLMHVFMLIYFKDYQSDKKVYPLMPYFSDLSDQNQKKLKNFLIINFLWNGLYKSDFIKYMLPEGRENFFLKVFYEPEDPKNHDKFYIIFKKFYWPYFQKISQVNIDKNNSWVNEDVIRYQNFLWFYLLNKEINKIYGKLNPYFAMHLMLHDKARLGWLRELSSIRPSFYRKRF